MSELPNRLAVTLLAVVLLTTVITTVAFYQMEQSMPVYQVSDTSDSVGRVQIKLDEGVQYSEPHEAKVAIKIDEVG